MISDDIELVDSVMRDGGVWSHKREAWNRIKAALAKSNDSTPQSDSVPLSAVEEVLRERHFVSFDGRNIIPGDVETIMDAIRARKG